MKRLLLLLALFLPASASGQINVGLMPFTKSQWFTDNGLPASGYYLCSYQGGSSTPLATYTDHLGTTPNSNPVHLDAAGRANVWLQVGISYKLILYGTDGASCNGTLVWSEDGIILSSGTGGLVGLQVNDADVGVPEQKIDLVAASGVTIVGTADHANGRNKATFTVSGSSSCTNLTQVTDWYVDTAGSDSTGDGTSAHPWATIQHAIDTGVPGIVCGRYIIHAKTAGTYVGRVNLSGRIFAGGGTAYQNDSYWPYSNDSGGGITDNTWPYSWVEILGSTASTGTFIIQPDLTGGTTCDGEAVIATSAANLTIRGFTIRYGGYGILAENGSTINPEGVAFTANCTAMQMIHHSRLHFDGSGTVNDDNVHYITITNGTVAAVPVNANDGIVLVDGSFMDDNGSQNTQQAPFGGAAIAVTDNNAAAALLHALLVEAGSYVNLLAEFDVTVNPANSQGACLEADNSHVSIDGGLNCTGVQSANTNAVFLIHSALTMEGNSGIWNLTSWGNGFRLEEGSYVAPLDSGLMSLTNVTHTFSTRGGGASTVPSIVRSRDIFTGVGSLIQTVPFSATPIFDPKNGGIFKITLTGDVTSSTMATGSGQDGQEITFYIIQDGSGGHSFVAPTNVKGFTNLSGSGAAYIDQTASATTIRKFFYDAATDTYLPVGHEPVFSFISGFDPNALTITTGPVGPAYTLLDKPAFITRLIGSVGTAPVTCVTQATETVQTAATLGGATTDLAVAASTSNTHNYLDSGLTMVFVPAGTWLTFNRTTAAATCGTAPANLNASVQFVIP
jgi:hypothetical protein